MHTHPAPRITTCCALLLLAACGGKGDDGDGGDARVRLLNLSTGYSSLDLITNLDDDDDDEDETQASAVALDAVSGYVTLDPDDYTIKLKRTGSGSILRSFGGEQLTEGAINTYVAFGEPGAFGALRLDDTQDEPDPGEHKLGIVNLSTAGALDVYLTDTDTDLDDTTPVVSSAGASVVAFSTDSGTFRLRVTAAGDNTDVRLDLPAFQLADKGIGTLILTSSRGGMLANAVYLPQQGQPQKMNNTRARLRAAVGVANGAATSIQAGGKSLLSAATAGVIANRYALLEAGAVPVTLTVDGTAVPVPDLELQAGADYTLLAWSNAAGPQATLVVDDNRLPSNSSRTRLRLLNAMSTLSAPLTLSMDFSPIIEGTLVGEVSDPVEVQSDTDHQFDLTNTSTAALVLTRTSITLQPNTVYTLFLTDNGATPLGVLRRDR
ncbi:MAG TPA: DUF4397 domain-containing protein [Steroidobacteraceae bacterium]|nr:DUF4397 domain-containing protein [Steroidobacteraceae bacterium]